MQEITDKSPEYQQAHDYLFSRVNYERMRQLPYPERAFKLDRMQTLAAGIGSPQSDLTILHIAGTKGKGSTAAIAASILQEAGMHVGVFSSPHVHHVEERIAIDGLMCPPGDFVALLQAIRPVVEEMDAAVDEDDPERAIGPTYFEILTAAALLQFQRKKVDVAILEVGLGGRLDSTNICSPSVSVITNIGFDHVQQLGNTLAAIATEKAGIVKAGVPVVSGTVLPEPRQVISSLARERVSPLFEIGTDFDVHSEGADASGRHTFHYCEQADGKEYRIEGLVSGMAGRFQTHNAGVAIAAIRQMPTIGPHVTKEHIRRGVAAASCPARLEVIARDPMVLIDAAHNIDSAQALLDVLLTSELPERRILVFAATVEKDYTAMLRAIVPQFQAVILTQYGVSPRGVPRQELLDTLRRIVPRDSCSMETADTPELAMRRALQLATPDDMICITGSFFIAAEVRDLYRKQEG